MKAKIEVFRGEWLESQHDLDFIILSENKSLAESETVDETIFPRSAIKFLQAYDFVLSGAYLASKSGRKELSLACASHNSEKEHVDTVLNWLYRNGRKEEDLLCGPSYPRRDEDLIEAVKENRSFGKAYNNCSGKHTAMLLNALHLDLDPKEYILHKSEIQKRFIKNLEELCNEKISPLTYAIDGCGLPNYRMSLRQIAKAMRSFSLLQAGDSQESFSSKEIIAAIREYPDMLAGKQRLCSEIIKASQGRILAKVGAEGVYTAILPEENISIALKIKDGSFRAVEVALSGLLNHYGLLKNKEKEELDNWIHRPLKNTLKEKVGHIALKIDE